MANELTITVSATYKKGNVAEFSRTLTAKKVTVSANLGVYHIQNIGTSEEALDLGALMSEPSRSKQASPALSRMMSLLAPVAERIST